jgi:hypothetical protein
MRLASEQTRFVMVDNFCERKANALQPGSPLAGFFIKFST